MEPVAPETLLQMSPWHRWSCWLMPHTLPPGFGCTCTRCMPLHTRAGCVLSMSWVSGKLGQADNGRGAQHEVSIALGDQADCAIRRA